MKKEEVCRRCGQKLEDYPEGFDAFKLFDRRKLAYCNNPKCKMYRILVVVEEDDEGNFNQE